MLVGGWGKALRLTGGTFLLCRKAGISIWEKPDITTWG